MFHSYAVANEFIAISIEKNKLVTPMKLLKLVYFAHGWHLGLYGTGLIDEQVEAWKYGPVVESIYHEVKNYGTNNIASLISRTDFETMHVDTPRIDCSNEDGMRAVSLIQRVWDLYSPFSGIKLSNMTHQPGTPWFETWKPMESKPIKGTDIPIAAIRNHFCELAKR